MPFFRLIAANVVAAIIILPVSRCPHLQIVQADERPNVLLLLVDDLKPSFGAYGDKWVHSPNLDRLANSGMRFDMAYCNQAVCAPSRNNLLTGARSTSLGVYSLGYNFRRAVPDAVTLPQYFKQHGYHSAGIGKVFHIGHGNVGDDASWSVPFQPDKVIDYVLPESTDGKLTREEALFSNRSKTGLPRGAAWEAADVDDDAYADGRIAVEGIKRLQEYEQSKQPFFLTLGFTKPHLPFCAPKKYWELYDPQQMKLAEHASPPDGAPIYAGKTIGELNQYKPVPDSPPLTEEMTRTLIHGYYAALSYMDAQLGRVLDALDQLELDDNTIVVLWGDHGYHLGDHGMWTKHTNYEQANRIPILIRAPGHSSAGSSSRALVETVDIYPTLCDLAGLPMPTGPQPIDGKSLAPLLKDPDATVRDHAYHCFPKGKRLGRAIRTDRYRLVEWKPWNSKDGDVEYELYDYEDAPLETKNLAAAKPALVEQLSATLATHPAAKPAHNDSLQRPSTSSSRSIPTPLIAKRSLTITAEVEAAVPHGVVLAQGGREHGFALHFQNAQPTFDVRVAGQVTRLAAKNPVTQKTLRLQATLTPHTMTLSINDLPAASCKSPGLIPVQPKDGLSVGLDDQTAAGNYDAPNPFNGAVVSAQVVPAN